MKVTNDKKITDIKCVNRAKVALREKSKAQIGKPTSRGRRKMSSTKKNGYVGHAGQEATDSHVDNRLASRVCHHAQIESGSDR